MPRRHTKFKDVQINAVTGLYPNRVLKVYDAPETAAALTVPAGTKLIEFVIPNPSHAQPITTPAGLRAAIMVGDWYDDQAEAGGTAQVYTISERVVDGSGNPVDAIIEDGTVGLPGSGADLIMQDTNILQNRGFRVQSYTIQI